MNKEQYTKEANIILLQEVNKFRNSNAKNKFSNQQVEYTMRRLAERIVNLTIRKINLIKNE